jgi:hypothetical protein
MCGIVCFFGQSHGIQRVVEALQLLEYRAPDSAGVGGLCGPQGELAIRRGVGFTYNLIQAMAHNPLYTNPPHRPPESIVTMLRRQGLAAANLRDCSLTNGYTIESLFQSDSLHIGVGDTGSPSLSLQDETCRFSAQMCVTLRETGSLSSPDYDLDVVRHVFRLVAANVASRVTDNPDCGEALNQALLQRVPPGVYGSWQEAWAEETSVNTPGQAFAVAVRYFQESFPGLRQHLKPDEWERVGGITARAMAHIIIGHGRWAMVGAPTIKNSHPILDRSENRAVCENGSHHAGLILQLRAEQEIWWHTRGVPSTELVHRSENSSEVIVLEWERAYLQQRDNELSDGDRQFLTQLAGWAIESPHEQSLRLAMERLGQEHTHACALYSRFEPGVLYVTSHRKPIAIALRTIEPEPAHQTVARYEVMVASDVNAALMLWSGPEIDEAAKKIAALRKETTGNKPPSAAAARRDWMI